MIRVFLIPVLLQALLIIHVIKTGRNTSWIYLLIFLPFAGGIAYVVVEIFPSLFSRRNLDKMSGSVENFVNPSSRLGKLEEKVQFSPTFNNVSAIGDEYLNLGRYSDAAAAYKRCLKPPFDDNDEYLYRLAFAHYKCLDFDSAEQVMIHIGEIGLGRYKAQELLLYAKIQEGLENQDEAKKLYTEASDKTGDLSYGYELAAYLRRSGDLDGAQKKFMLITDTYGRLPRPLKKQYRQVMADINREIAELTDKSPIQ